MTVERVNGGVVTLRGEAVPVEVRVNPRARRLILRLGRERQVFVTCPSRSHVKEALAMVNARRAWISDRLAETPAPIAFTQGQRLPVLGTEREVVRLRRGRSSLEADRILVSGDCDRVVARRVEKVLREAVLMQCREMANAFSDEIGVEAGPVSVRQMTSRWGSCSCSGSLSFNWRLCFAPPHVLRYVVAHEVAHRRHMNHSPAFWRLVTELDPDYEAAANWLRSHGAKLHAYGQSPLRRAA